jgi:hypothetical protein
MMSKYSVLTFVTIIGLIALPPVVRAAPDLSLHPPRGYVERLEIEIGDQLYRFGPFVGYYFKPIEPNNLQRLLFVCYNEDSFYSSDSGAGTLLFSGEARLTQLPVSSSQIPRRSSRIVPVFFAETPKPWLISRPEPQAEFVHFHSLYNARGAAAYGYWLKHRAEASFTYDMGGKVEYSSPLYHQVKPGTDLAFPHIVEFDHGPDHD